MIRLVDSWLSASDREPTHPSYHYRARKCFNSGPQAIISKLLEFDDLTHSPTIDSTSFQFDITAFADLGCVLLKFYGELYNRHTVERPSSVALRFDRSFLLRQNDVNSPSWWGLALVFKSSLTTSQDRLAMDHYQ